MFYLPFLPPFEILFRLQDRLKQVRCGITRRVLLLSLLIHLHRRKYLEGVILRASPHHKFNFHRRRSHRNPSILYDGLISYTKSAESYYNIFWAEFRAASNLNYCVNTIRLTVPKMNLSYKKYPSIFRQLHKSWLIFWRFKWREIHTTGRIWIFVANHNFCDHQRRSFR